MASSSVSATCVIDTDPGIDDALAILLALDSPELEVIALTTVHGNVPLAYTTRNALRILELADRADIPVYLGEDLPLEREACHAAEVHGQDGLGGSDLPDPTISAREDAVGYLVDEIERLGDGLTVVCLGPLTNLALAEQRAPGVLARAGRIVVMGGAVVEPGNVTPVAEFNFFADPEAARQVLRAGASLTVVPLDVTHRVMLEDPIVVSGASGNARAGFAAGVVSAAMGHSQQVTGIRRFYLHDPLAVGVAIDPSLCGYERFSADVETRGELTVGQLVTDRRERAGTSGKAGHPSDCAMTVDAGRFVATFRERVLT